ncbi:MAG: SMC-Scp complex subunit ScpB [Candidatus Borkfalkiaceae bacterium]|nr:SMC-Scp complex subunit ScpB [Christensenellaceae bacterium]
MKNSEKLTNILESILYVSGTQVAISDISEKLGVTDKEIKDCAKILQEKYSGNSGIQLLVFNNKLQFCSNPSYAEDVSSVLNPIKERELTKSMLEVAAIIAYKQPVTRIDLEEIRGNSEYAVQKLLELGIIEPVGRKDAVGRPVLFGTTDKFLKRFQISSLDELPDYEELINKISLIHGESSSDDYLYRKDVYSDAEDENDDKLVAATTEEAETTDATDKKETPETADDFELPDLENEEIPDFLKGEEVEKI